MMKKISKNKVLGILCFVCAILFLYATIQGFMGNDLFEGVKNLVLFGFAGLIGVLWLLPAKKQEEKHD